MGLFWVDEGVQTPTCLNHPSPEYGKTMGKNDENDGITLW